MGIKEMDHDTFANGRNRWIGRSGVVIGPSNVKQRCSGRRMAHSLQGDDQEAGRMTLTLGVVHDNQSPFERGADGRE